MKIGIVTQPLCNNYGGILQNYALQYVLKKLGYEPKTIDIVYRISFPRYFFSVCKQLLISIIKFKCPNIASYTEFPMLRKPIIDDFVDMYIDRTRIVYSYNSQIIKEEHFDAVITGSDQVWRPKYNLYIEDMYLKFVPSGIKKIAYAASFGVDNWEYSSLLTRRCTKYAKRLDAISVREISGVTLCKKNLNVNANCVLDPTLLAGVDAYIPMLNGYDGEDYLFAYMLDLSVEKRQFIESIAKDMGLELRVYGADDNAVLTVDEWLSMIANASMVVTDSYHGTVFSVLYHRMFYTIINHDRGGTRLVSMLISLGLQGHMGNIYQFLLSRLTDINWINVEAKLSKLRDESMNFLIKSLKNES